MDVYPDMGRFALVYQYILSDTHEVVLHNLDTRRTVLVSLPNPDGFEINHDNDPEGLLPVKNAVEVLEKHTADLPPDTVAMYTDGSSLLSVSTDAEKDLTHGTNHFPLEEHQLPPHIAAKTVLRSELTEARRFVAEVDLVSYPPSLCPSSSGRKAKTAGRYIFKYSPSLANGLWKQVQMLARLPRHPSLVPIDRLVLDELTGTRVVGFTMPYIASDSLEHAKPPLFKLKWLRQLMQLADDLNLEHGVVHQAIFHRNLIIDPESDSIVLVNFDAASRVGVTMKSNNVRDHEGIVETMDNVSGIMLFLYKIHHSRSSAP